jgi:SAM-dependent methyltransferase
VASEEIVRAFHAARQGATAAALARTGSYERLWAQVAAALPHAGARILDLACGDRAMPGAIGCDVSREELARGTDPRVQARAQALPFAAGAFDAALCHLAFMLFDDIEAVVRELDRVLAPGAAFHALLGGGPIADGGDTFHAFAQLMPKAAPLGDPRSKSVAGWRGLFSPASGWSDPVFERWELDLSGAFDDVWLFLGGAYQLREADRVRAELRARFPTDPVPCKVAAYYARVTR